MHIPESVSVVSFKMVVIAVMRPIVGDLLIIYKRQPQQPHVRFQPSSLSLHNNHTLLFPCSALPFPFTHNQSETMYSKLATISALVAAARAQQACTLTTETKPTLTWETCKSGGSCTSNSGKSLYLPVCECQLIWNFQGLVVIDANWRWVHDVNSSTNCYTGNTCQSTLGLARANSRLRQ